MTSPSDRPVSADERLRRAAERLKAANAELDAAEREHGEAVAEVESTECRQCGPREIALGKCDCMRKVYARG